MIYKKCIMTINKNNATLDEDIYIYLDWIKILSCIFQL